MELLLLVFIIVIVIVIIIIRFRFQKWLRLIIECHSHFLRLGNVERSEFRLNTISTVICLWLLKRVQGYVCVYFFFFFMFYPLCTWGFGLVGLWLIKVWLCWESLESGCGRQFVLSCLIFYNCRNEVRASFESSRPLPCMSVFHCRVSLTLAKQDDFIFLFVLTICRCKIKVFLFSFEKNDRYF